MTPRSLFRMRTCLAELAGNIVEHGGVGARQAMFRVTLAPEAGGLAAEIVDRGVAFDPTIAAPAPASTIAATSPGGRGLRTVHRLATDLRYVRVADENRLRLVVPAER